ncbi:uncharacterized protein LOC120349601 [Nilaparvata lugens]|uniref:uncharacterized protein LOC120349601 n=1 Tax=Nilaparvata lugens TaxID=108931 RepID=UPI00193E96E0|nr:uncharacterized protein LOC120349601 [Nilaparvata lugens]
MDNPDTINNRDKDNPADEEQTGGHQKRSMDNPDKDNQGQDNPEKDNLAAGEHQQRYKRFSYTIDTLQKAIEEVKAGRISSNKASKEYGIPKGTLIKKLHSNEPLRLKMGPSSVLTNDKKWMELFLKRHPKIGFRNSEIVSRARALVTEAKIREWFDELVEYLKEEKSEDILNCPDRIYNHYIHTAYIKYYVISMLQVIFLNP